MEHTYIGRQPIIGTDGELYAYEVLYRDKNKTSTISDGRYASASVISSILNKFGTRTLLGHHMAFVKIDRKFLMQDLIFSIPNEFFIFSILDDVEIDERVIERVEQLVDKGYKLAINDTVLDSKKIENLTPILSKLSFVKINFDKGVSVECESFITRIKANGTKIVATIIENSSEYDLAKKLGCELFQGYFFAEPRIIENAKLDSDRLSIIKLTDLLMRDTNIDEITLEFENNHAITVQLLQFINSGYFHFRNRISSIHHILMLMGRHPLAQWLMLMIYSKSVSKSKDNSPLMLMVKSRTELMQSLIKAVEPDVGSNTLGEAYFVGVLSLIDTLFGVELSRVLEHLHISDDVQNALLKDEGILGELYALVRDVEGFNTEAITIFATKHNLNHETIHDIMMHSIKEVNSFEDATALEE
ncbi:MAG: EAL domain-containing protein [Sulfurimonas sp.]|nr:EAL domain-containing protein [Sulfurimonas sp.]